MTAAHEVSAARELISVAEKQQYFDICDYQCITLHAFFRSKNKEILKQDVFASFSSNAS